MTKKLFTLFTLILLAIPLAWGDTWSYTFSSGEVSTGGSSITYGGFTWTSSTATFIGFDNSKGVQIGSGSNPQNQTPWTLTISDFTSYRITDVTVNASVAKSGGATIDVSVGGEAFGSQVTLTSSNTTNAAYSFSGSKMGNVVISMKSTAAKAMYIRSVVVTYESGSTPSGPSYYLVGSFNMNGTDWVLKDPNYMFNSDGELNEVNLPDDVEFKIIKVDGQTITWYGGSANNNQPYVLDGGHHTGIELKTEPYTGQTIENFKMSVGGISNFTLDTENMKFSVEKATPQFYFKSSADWTQKEPMTQTDGGWTTTMEIAGGTNFGFNDEWTWYGRDNYWITDQTVDKDIDLYNDGTFYMENTGTYTLFVNSDKTKLKVTKIPEGEKYELITSVDDLDPNYEYIVVGKNNVPQYYVMGKTMNSNSGSNRAMGIQVTPDANGRITATNDMAIITLGGSTGAWTLHTSVGYVVSDGKNSMQFSDNAETATIGFGLRDVDDDESAVINFGGDYPLLKFATGNNWFACYADNTTPVHLYLYKKMSASELSPAPVISPLSGDVVGFSQEVTIEGAEGATIYYTSTTDGTDPADPTEASTVYNGSFYVGGADVTYGQVIKIKAVAKDGNLDLSYPARVTYKFVEPRKPVFNFDETTYQVSLSSNTAGADIYYTTDESLTTDQIVAKGTKYTAPFTVSGTVTYYAVAAFYDEHAEKYAINTNKVQAEYTGPVLGIALADLESTNNGGVVGNTYTINDPLQVVYFDSTKDFAIARDLTGTTVTPNGIDYMTTVVKEHTGEWKQYNWVMLDLGGVTSLPENFINGIIAGETLTGKYTDNENYTIKVDNATLSVTSGDAYVPYVYCPANFQVDANGCQTGYLVEWKEGAVVNNVQLYNMVVGETANAATYWFMTPKPMEVFELSGALWCGDGFYMEQRLYVPASETETGTEKWFNPAGLKGGIALNKNFNSTSSPSLTQGQSYRFLTVAMKPTSGQGTQSNPSGAPLRGYSLQPEQGSILNTTIQAGALNLTGDSGQIVTGVSEVKNGSDVVSVTYCDLAGRMSQKPFAGVNIIVTRYSDGTVKTTKAIK